MAAYAKCVSENRASDPRYQRVNAALVAAVLELSAEKPAEEISIAELTKTAGVHRTSFYSHAASPAELLVQVLAADLGTRLDRLIADPLVAQQPVDFWMEFYRCVLGSVHSQKKVWSVLVADNSAVLIGIRRTLETKAREVFPTIMHGWLDQPEPLKSEIACQQVAFNAIAVVTSWVATDFGSSVEEVMRDYRALAPPWQLARRSEQGDIVLGRGSRSHGTVKEIPAKRQSRDRA